jgi:hypothetical protein
MSNDNPLMFPDEHWWFDHEVDASGQGFEYLLSELVSMGCLEGKAMGIAKQVLDEGRESLSPNQAWVLEYEVMRDYAQQSCERCGEDLQWDEMPGISLTDGCCGYCHFKLTEAD